MYPHFIQYSILYGRKCHKRCTLVPTFYTIQHYGRKCHKRCTLVPTFYLYVLKFQYILFLTFTGLFTVQTTIIRICTFLKISARTTKKKHFLYKNGVGKSRDTVYISFRILHGLAAAGGPAGPPRLPLRVLHHGPECHCSRGLQRGCQEVRFHD